MPWVRLQKLIHLYKLSLFLSYLECNRWTSGVRTLPSRSPAPTGIISTRLFVSWEESHERNRSSVCSLHPSSGICFWRNLRVLIRKSECLPFPRVYLKVYCSTCSPTSSILPLSFRNSISYLHFLQSVRWCSHQLWNRVIQMQLWIQKTLSVHTVTDSRRRAEDTRILCARADSSAAFRMTFLLAEHHTDGGREQFRRRGRRNTFFLLFCHDFRLFNSFYLLLRTKKGEEVSALTWRLPDTFDKSMLK